MWYAAILRFLRRRIILGLILTLSLCYCIFSYVGKSEFLDNDDVVPIKRTQPFIWRTLQQHNSSNDVDDTCRNSVQGKVLIVDDRGYVCPRSEILSNGCCNSETQHVLQYPCETCNPNNCCAIFEYCISCCLHPDKKNVLEMILKKATEQNNVLFASVSDHFELCLAKCRTNSQSVQHENSYKDPKAKHCYGETAPTANSIDEA
ncbi:SREBP regulating gene protein [Anthonomus grandis grandis]|uniref:SREBP regulating gene protein n=1 Tax=Anthonomus grandis grandis TaxID=2921223 RepID=UPI0021664E75|nr:SREBP regulating gene protein [Anthonomus grandis grandis]